MSYILLDGFTMICYDWFTMIAMLFVYRAGKIPKNMLSAYQSACKKVTTDQIEGNVLTNT